ncbi:hypothetical protein ACFLXC_03440 [Chloroflexota bacterium]
MKIIRTSPLSKTVSRALGNEAGDSFLTALVAMAIIGLICAVSLSGLTTVLKASIITDEQATAGSLARTQMELAKKADYVYEAAGYDPAEIPDTSDYVNYSVGITAEPLHNPDEGLQIITVTVSRNEKDILTLTGYKRSVSE